MSKTTVIVKLTAAEGKRDEVAEALGRMFPQVESEDGTELYVLHEDAGDPNVLWMYGFYTDGDALQAHSRAMPWPRLMGAMGGMLARRRCRSRPRPGPRASSLTARRWSLPPRRYLEAHRARAAADRRPVGGLDERARAAGATRPFRGALRDDEHLSVIGEVKRRSPSKGDLAPGIDVPARLAADSVGQ
ncbi:MAG: antibiotic biosynthesis monooxygenase [Acidimicrobiia bacterium]|nr:antibiotic biosynthesis monooxygenase [Acidimicrobiia bacterium]